MTLKMSREADARAPLRPRCKTFTQVTAMKQNAGRVIVRGRLPSTAAPPARCFKLEPRSKP